jgi:hypothetical protein
VIIANILDNPLSFERILTNTFSVKAKCPTSGNYTRTGCGGRGGNYTLLGQPRPSRNPCRSGQHLNNHGMCVPNIIHTPIRCPPSPHVTTRGMCVR